MPRLERLPLPTVEEMMEALSSPIVPDGGAPVENSAETAPSLSTDDMVRAIFEMMTSAFSQGGNAPSDGVM